MSRELLDKCLRMNIPTYTRCPHIYHNNKDYWKANHIPFAGYYYRKYSQPQYAVFDAFFERYMRMKLIAFPDEVDNFYNLFERKHPELNFRKSEYHYKRIVGAAYSNGEIIDLFAEKGLVRQKPVSPKPNDRQSILFKLVTTEFIKHAKHGFNKHGQFIGINYSYTKLW